MARAFAHDWTEYASREELLACLNHLLAGAGNASLMTPGLRQTLCDHAAGNFESSYGLQLWRYYDQLPEHERPARFNGERF